MALSDDFAAAQERVKTLVRAPDTSTLLELYALFKQGSLGDAHGGRPGLLDVKGRAKYDAWAKKKGMPREVAMQQYVALVERLAKAG